MKLLALESETSPLPVDIRKRVLRAEAEAVWGLVKSGIVREIYFDAETRDAVLVLECADRDEAVNALASLPLAAGGYSRFTVKPLVPYDGFERLFSPS